MDIQVFDLFVEPAEAYTLLHKEVWPRLQPHWISRCVVSKEFTAGYINNMVVYYIDGDIGLDDALVVRLFGYKPDGFPSRDLEFIKMQLSYYAGTFSKPRAVLQNGIIYEYAKGRTLRGEDIQDPTVIRAFTRSLAQFHWIDPSQCHLMDMRGNKTSFESRDNFIGDIRGILQGFIGFMSTLQEEDRVLYTSIVERLQEELLFLERYLDDIKLPVANGHCSLNSNNVVYNEETGVVLFLDYEYSGYGVPATHDISCILNYHLWKKYLGKIPKAEGPVSPETRHLWLRSYLERKCELEGRELDEQEAELWMTSSQITDVSFMLFRAVEKLAFLQQSKFKLPFLEMAEFTLATFMERKPQLAPLREKYLNLKSKMS